MKRLTAYIAVLSWLSFFALSWLMILYDRFQNGIGIFFWMFFLVIAFTASTVTEGKKHVDK